MATTYDTIGVDASATVNRYSAEEVANVIKTKLGIAKSARIQWEAWCATVQNFFDGRHRSWWTEQGKLIESPIRDGEIWRQINLFPGTEDVRQNRLTKNDPRWHVKQSYGIQASQEDLDAANAYLQSVYRDQNWKDSIKSIIGYGDKRGNCPTIIGWDDEEDVPTLTYYDSWDFYPDPSSPDPKGWWWLICSTPKSVDEIKGREDFTKEYRDKIEADNKYAQSGLKDQLERQRRGGQQAAGQVLYNQFFVRTSEGIVQYINIGDFLMKEPKLLPYKTFDEFIDIYKPRNNERFYERPPCADWIDPQKTINKLFSNAEGYCDMMLQGRWRVSDKSITIPVGGQNGQVIEATIGDLEQYSMIPLPQTHFQVMDRALSYFENISGVHGESLGRLSGSVDSGIGINSLQAADEQNSATAVDNLKTFLSRIATKVLKVASLNLKISTPIFTEHGPGETVRLDVIGEEFKTLRDLPKDVVGIKPFDNIEVEIIVGTAYSDLQQQNTVMELIKSGYMPGNNPILDRIVVTFWRIGNQREVMKMMEDFRDPDRMIAAAENFKMRNGAFIVPQASDNHQIHLEIHTLEQKRLQAIGDLQAMKNTTDHMEEHRQIMDQLRNKIRSDMGGGGAQ